MRTNVVRFTYRGELYWVGLFGSSLTFQMWYPSDPDNDEQGQWYEVSDPVLTNAVVAWYVNDIDMPVAEYLGRMFNANGTA